MNILAVEHVAHERRRAASLLLPTALSDTEHDAPLIVEVDIGVIAGHVREKVKRRIVVKCVVHPAVGEEFCVVDARESEHAVKEIGTAEECDGCMQTAEAASGGNGQTFARILCAYEGDDLVDDVAVVLFLPLCAPRFVAPDIGPCLRVDRIHAKELDASAAQILRQQLDHAEVLEVVAHCVLCREDEHGNTARHSVDAYIHHAVQPRTVPIRFFPVCHD